jgi:hypothetical protein
MRVPEQRQLGARQPTHDRSARLYAVSSGSTCLPIHMLACCWWLGEAHILATQGARGQTRSPNPISINYLASKECAKSRSTVDLALSTFGSQSKRLGSGLAPLVPASPLKLDSATKICSKRVYQPA